MPKEPKEPEAPRLLMEWRKSLPPDDNQREISTHLSQVNLARRLGISNQTVLKLEQGARLPSLLTAARIEVQSGGMIPCTSWFLPRKLDDER